MTESPTPFTKRGQAANPTGLCQVEATAATDTDLASVEAAATIVRGDTLHQTEPETTADTPAYQPKYGEAIPPQVSEWLPALLRDLLPTLAETLRDWLATVDAGLLDTGTPGEPADAPIGRYSTDTFVHEELLHGAWSPSNGSQPELDFGSDASLAAEQRVRLALWDLTRYAVEFHPICEDPREEVPEDVPGGDELAALRADHHEARGIKRRDIIRDVKQLWKQDDPAGRGLRTLAEVLGRVVRYRDTPPLLVLELDTDAWQQCNDPGTRQRSLDALRALGHVCRVAVVTSPETGKRIEDLHTDWYDEHVHPLYAPTDLTQHTTTAIRDQEWPATSPGGDHDSSDALTKDTYREARQALHDLTPATARVDLVNHLSAMEWRPLPDLVTDTAIGTTKRDTLYRYLGELAERNLIDKRGHDPLEARLTPVGVAAQQFLTEDGRFRERPPQTTLGMDLYAPADADTQEIPQTASGAESSSSAADPAGDGSSRHAALNRTLTPNPTTSTSVVCSEGQRGRGDASSASSPPAPSTPPWERDGVAALDDCLAATGDPANEDGDFVQWLAGPEEDRVFGGGWWPMHAWAGAAAREDAAVTLVDADVGNFWDPQDGGDGDGRVGYVSVSDDDDDDVQVVTQYGGPVATLGRLPAILLSDRLWNKVLTPSAVEEAFEKLDDELDRAVDRVLRLGRQLGWVGRDDIDDYDTFRERWTAIRNQLLARLGNVTPASSAAEIGELLRDAHGLFASVTHLYDVLGYDVTITLRFPDGVQKPEKFRDFVRYTIPKNATYKQHSLWRLLVEEEPEKLKHRLAYTDDITPLEQPTADATASWVFVGEGLAAQQEAIQTAIESVPLRVEVGIAFQPAIKVGSTATAVQEVIETFSTRKGYETDPDSVEAVTRCLQSVLGEERNGGLHVSPYDVAEVFLRMGAATEPGEELTLADLEYGLSRLPPERLYPSLQAGGSDTIGRIVAVLLDADGPLRRSEIVERIDRTGTTFDNNVETLRAADIVHQDEHDFWSAHVVPWWAPASETMPTDDAPLAQATTTPTGAATTDGGISDRQPSQTTSDADAGDATHDGLSSKTEDGQIAGDDATPNDADADDGDRDETGDSTRGPSPAPDTHTDHDDTASSTIIKAASAADCDTTTRQRDQTGTPSQEAEQPPVAATVPEGESGEVMAAFQEAIAYFHAQIDTEIAAHTTDGSHPGRPTTAREYFQARGWGDATIDEHLLGWAPPDASVRDHLLEQGYDWETLAATGLFTQDGTLRPLWRGRYVFPYFDEAHEPVYAIARCTGDEGGGAKGYDGHPEDFLAGKYGEPRHTDDAVPVSEPVWGMHTLREGEDVVIAEGLPDALSAAAVGYAVLSPVGTTLASTQQAEIKRVLDSYDVSRVTIIPDADPVSWERAPTESESEPSSAQIREAVEMPVIGAGRRGALETAAWVADQTDVTVRVASLPQPAQLKVDLDAYLQAWDGDVGAVLTSARPPDADPVYESIAGDDDDAPVGSTAMESVSGGTEGEATAAGEDTSALWDLDITDLTGMAVGDRGVNPIKHIGESRDYFRVREGDDGNAVADDYKRGVTYNAVTCLLGAAGERPIDAPGGPLSDWEIWIAWKQARQCGALEAGDRVPYRALCGIARQQALCAADDIPTSSECDAESLSRDVYRQAVEHVEAVVGDAGRDAVVRTGSETSDGQARPSPPPTWTPADVTVEEPSMAYVIERIAAQCGYAPDEARAIAGTLTADAELTDVPGEVEQWVPVLRAYFGQHRDADAEHEAALATLGTLPASATTAQQTLSAAD